MIHDDVLIRLPDQARAKLLLIDGLASDADDMARSAQIRLNNLGRQYPGVGAANPNVARLGAAVDQHAHRHRELSDLIGSCTRWVRGLPPDAPLDVVPAPAPTPFMEEGEMLTAEDAVVRISAKIGELVIERMHVTQAPEPKAEIKASLRVQMARLAEISRPTLKSERGRAEAVFNDMRADFGISPGYVAGMFAWLFPDQMIEALDELVDAALPDDGSAMSADVQEKALKRLDAEIEQLGRVEEALIEAAFGHGVDVLRRSAADPACVLGLRLRMVALAERPSRRRRDARRGLLPAVIETPAVAVAETTSASQATE